MTDEDVRNLLAVVEGCEADDDRDFFYADVLAGLRALIPCTEIGFELMELGSPGEASAVPELKRLRALEVYEGIGVEREDEFGPDDDDEIGQMWWQEFWADGGCAGPLLTGDYATILRCNFAERASINTPFDAMVAAEGYRHLLEVPITPYGGAERRLLLWRHDGPDFTEREELMVRLIRPHLAELHACRDRELRGVPNLTPRQWQILREVATGATNTQVARTLGLSEATVRKHMENIFLRLQVLSRTEALAQVHPFLDAARPLPVPLRVAAAS